MIQYEDLLQNELYPFMSIYMRYLQLKPLRFKNKENKKNCDAFDHNLKNKPLL